VQNAGVHVAKIAGHQEGDDLAAAIRQQFVAAGPALQHDEDRARLVPLADQKMVSRQAAAVLTKVLEERTIGFAQQAVAGELVDKDIAHRFSAYRTHPARGLI